MTFPTLIERFLNRFFADRYCSECRCGTEHHVLEKEESPSRMSLFCKHHHRCCGFMDLTDMVIES